MNNLEKEIIELLNKEGKSLKVKYMAKKLEVEVEDLKKCLRYLQGKLKVKCNENGTYQLLETKNMRSGIITINFQGVGIVKLGNNSEIKVPQHKLNGALNGDTVLISIKQTKKGKIEGRVEEKIGRDLGIMTGLVYMRDGVPYIKTNSSRTDIKIKVDNVNGLVEGHKVLFKILEQNDNKEYVAEVVKISDHKNDIGADVLALASAMGINDVFPDDVIEEATQIPNEVSEEELKDRRDLRDEIIFTIDGDDAKDLDDAISIKINEDGNYVLGVHIADVSHYVPINSAIGREAYERGTSVYLVGCAIPMLPHSLSNGICSLNEGVDRLTLSCEMELSPRGELLSYDVFESVINSKKRMTYNNVNDILERNQEVTGYEPFVESLQTMLELSHKVRKQKEKRGTISFGTNESYVKTNGNGEPIDVVLRTRGESEKIIEDFMILANESVASYIYEMELPFLYRNHDKPNEEKIDQVIDLIASIGYRVKKQSKNNEIDFTKTYQTILEELKDNPDFSIISKIMVRSMKKARYAAINEKHFGIASDCYTHFTSPIRRFPDLTVHRLLKKYVIEHNYDLKDSKEFTSRLDQIARHSSSREVSADECEREVTKMKHAEYMENYIGEEFDGWVSNITRNGMYVQLTNLIEGLVAMCKMDKSFVYDQEKITLTSVNLDLMYRIGSPVKIVVDSADKEMRMIGFSVANQKEYCKTYKLK
ncbi:MAG: ribonuclease R [Bacilli bacterium]